MVEHILRDTEVDTESGVPFSAIIFMLYYGLELKHFLLDISHDFMDTIPLKQYHIGSTSTYLSGSAAQGFYLNTKKISHARDIDIVTIWKKYPIKERCQYDDFSVEEWLLKSRSEGGNRCVCVSDIKVNQTSNECDDRYLNIKVLPDTPPGYVLLQKCRRHPVPIQTLDDILVSSLETTDSRLLYWNDIKDNLKQKYSGEYYVDENEVVHEEGPLFNFLSTHGPAVSAYMAGPGLLGGTMMFEGIDMVFALPYPLSWPELAREWINRQRPSGWPSQKLVQEVIADGCTLIPKGSTGSVLEDYEWRISFTGELRLARSLSPVQRQTMHILKALVSEPQNDLEFKPIGIDLTASVESFQFLNLMFRESEIINQKNWIPANIAHMLLHLIDRYLQYFQDGFLSHFFIKSRNILSKYKSLSDEDKDALLYSLYRIRKNPLEQILQQKRYIRLSAESHRLVFSPFVESVKSEGNISPNLYVDTLVSLSKAHIFERSYTSAQIYGMDALMFYRKTDDYTFSDEEYMDLFFTAALSCHRMGMQSKVLEYLEKLHIVMVAKSEELLTDFFGTRNYAELLVLFARTLIVNSYKGIEYSPLDEGFHHANRFYQDAQRIDASSMQISIDMLNTLLNVGDQSQAESLFTEIIKTFPDLEDLLPLRSDNRDGSVVEENVGSEFEVIYDRKSYSQDEVDLLPNLPSSSDNCDRSAVGNDGGNEFEVIYDRKSDFQDEVDFSNDPTDTSKYDALFGDTGSEVSIENTDFDIQVEEKTNNKEGKEEVDVEWTTSGDERQSEAELQDTCIENQSSEQRKDELDHKSALKEEQNVNDDISYNKYLGTEEEEFTEEDLWKIDSHIMRDYYQMKAFQEIKMEDKVEMIRKRLEMKLNDERKKGILASFKMLESLYNIYESLFRQQPVIQRDTFDLDIVSDDDEHIIYSVSDKLLLDDMIDNLFSLVKSTVIRIPIKVFFLHVYIQFNKQQGKIKQAKETLEHMENVVNSLDHVTDYAFGKFILASHLDWFGQTELANEMFAVAKENVVTSKDTVEPTSVKYKVQQWINEVFSTVAVNEPNNRYLDSIFAV